MIHDAWYVAALPEEIAEGLLSRRIVDIPVVVYRQANGRAAAMLDICPHRFAELSDGVLKDGNVQRSEEHTSELQSLMRISYAVFCLTKKKQQQESKLSNTPPQPYINSTHTHKPTTNT